MENEFTLFHIFPCSMDKYMVSSNSKYLNIKNRLNIEWYTHSSVSCFSIGKFENLARSLMSVEVETLRSQKIIFFSM